MRIALIRHGRPSADTNPTLDADGYRRWVAAYDRSEVAPTSQPPTALRERLEGWRVVSSPLLRARQSAELCLGRAPDDLLTDLRELDIPYYPLPLRMRAHQWVFVCRSLWMAGVPGSFESFRAGRTRSRRASQVLETMTDRHPNLAVFAHGMVLWRIARALQTTGWRGRFRPLKYWDVTWLER